MMPQGPKDEASISNATRTYLGRLAPLARLILLQEDCAGMLLGAGLIYPNFNNPKNQFPREPSATVMQSKKAGKSFLLGIKPDKALWRELHALVSHQQAEVGGFLAASLASSNHLSDNSHDLLVAGMSRDQASVVDTLESVYHIPAVLCEDGGRAVYEEGVLEAEQWEWRLSQAVQVYRLTVDEAWSVRLKNAGAKKDELISMLNRKALIFYWTGAEQNLSRLFACVRSLGTDAHQEERRNWSKALAAAARQAFRVACAPQTPRQFRAFACGFRFLCSPSTRQGKIDEESPS
jgi:CRISPR system Cascade subunit CasA